MMFIMHISALLALGVLLGSTTMIIWSCQSKKEGSCFGKKVGYVSFFLSILSFLCIIYFGVKYWLQGEFESSSPMHMRMHHPMMGGMMPPHMMPPPPMMGDMMGPKSEMGPKAEMGTTEEKDNQEHSHNHS